MRGFRIPLEEVKESLTEHLTSFESQYAQFSEESVNIIDVLNKLFENPLSNYNGDTTDLLAPNNFLISGVLSVLFLVCVLRLF